MSITLRNVTKIVLFAIVLAGMLLLVGVNASAVTPFKIQPNNSPNNCWSGSQTGSVKCCVGTTGPDCDFEVQQYSECGLIGLSGCDDTASPIYSKVIDLYGFSYCRTECPGEGEE